MALIGQSILEFDFFPDAPPAIIGELTTGKTVNIELWKNGTAVSVSASGCNEINNTGRYSWSTSGIATLAASREQFHWRMSDGIGGTDEGDFVLISHEDRDGGMPSLSSPNSYIVQN
jgi:hypothetical protein